MHNVNKMMHVHEEIKISCWLDCSVESLSVTIADSDIYWREYTGEKLPIFYMDERMCLCMEAGKTEGCLQANASYSLGFANPSAEGSLGKQSHILL